MKIKDLVKLGLDRWIGFWDGLQGPELEPPIWHSHFLALRSLDTDLGPVCRKLTGLVLDIGAGTGFGRRYLDARRARYVPTDLRTHRDPHDTRVTRRGEKLAVLCSGYALPFHDDCFDAVMAHSLLEHVHDPVKVLGEARRVLAPSGILVVSVPFCFPVHGLPDDFRRWTCQGLKLEMERAGFEVRNALPVGNGFYSLALNFNLLLRYTLPVRSRVLYILSAICRPLLLVSQAVVNSIALMLGPLDRTGSLPGGIALEAKKTPEPLAAARNL